jgi:hypothetical protein
LKSPPIGAKSCTIMRRVKRVARTLFPDVGPLRMIVLESSTF